MVIHARTDENRFALLAPEGTVTHVVANIVRFFVAVSGDFADLLTLPSVDPLLLRDPLRVLLLAQVSVEQVRAVDVSLGVIAERNQTTNN